MQTASLITAIALLASSASALSQESERQRERTLAVQKGQWDLDIKPMAGIGFGFQLSDRFSVRPLFGGFRPAETGNQLTLGVDFRYELTERSTWAPYVLGNVTYARNQLAEIETGGREAVPRSGIFGVGLGVRQPISKRWAVFGEISLQHSTIDHAKGVWNQIQFTDRDAARFGFGVTLNLKK